MLIVRIMIHGNCNEWNKQYKRLDELSDQELRQAEMFFVFHKCATNHQLNT